MKTKTKLFGALFALIASTPAFATNSLVTFLFADGSRYSYLLADSPKISYTSDSLKVSGTINDSYPLNEVLYYHFTEREQSEVPVIGSEEVRITYTDNTNVKVEGLQPNTSVVLYSTSGAAQIQKHSDVAGVVELQLPKNTGIYILKTNTKTVKLVKE